MATPHKCPVCFGKGKVPVGFYGDQGSDASEPQCRSCHGQGVLWDYSGPLPNIPSNPCLEPWKPNLGPTTNPIWINW